MSANDTVKLVQTCNACPEQYDAYIGDSQVGYLRLRHGYFSVRCPDAAGEEVLGAAPNGDGVFEYEEREHYLDAAKRAILSWVAVQ